MRGLEIVNLPVSHITVMLTEPYNTTLARALKKSILAFRARQTARIPGQIREGSEVA